MPDSPADPADLASPPPEPDPPAATPAAPAVVAAIAEAEPAAVATTDAAEDLFAHDVYHIRVKFLKLFGQGFIIRDAQRRPLMYADWLHFRLKQHLRVWRVSDSAHLLDIRQRNWSGSSGLYEVTDARTGTPLGALRRRAWRSFLRDHWWVLDTEGRRVGTIVERSGAMALWRRLTSNIWPQTFDIDYGDAAVGSLRDHSSWLYLSMTVDFTCDRAHRMDRRLGIAAAVLICSDELRTD